MELLQIVEKLEIQEQVCQTLKEDLSTGSDVTAALIPASESLCMQLWCRESAILCGRAWFEEAFMQLDPACQIEWLFEDGDAVNANSLIARLSGKARALLTAERTALNFIQTLSATATVTHQFQQLITNSQCALLDTRKTIPGLRLAQKYAVRCGGGKNHRIGLFDAILIKENHIAACGSITQAIGLAREQSPDLMVEVEVESLQQLEEAIAAKADRALLDNFDLAGLRQCVAVNQGQIELEASGNVDVHNLSEIAATGVDFISTGAITKHIRAVDFSLRFCE